jgi:hypothetical protein
MMKFPLTSTFFGPKLATGGQSLILRFRSEALSGRHVICVMLTGTVSKAITATYIYMLNHKP